MKTWPVLICLLLSAGIPASSQTASTSVQANHQQTVQVAPQGEAAKIDPAKAADIRRLLELTGAKTLMGQIMEATEQNIKPLMSNALPEGEYREKLVDLFFAKFQAKANLDELLDLAVPVYDKYFSHEEIKGLIAFYQTPLGQKTVSVLPKTVADMADASKHWGEELGRQCMQEVLSEHPDLAQAMEAADKSKQ